MPEGRPTINVTAFPDEVLLESEGPLVPRKLYARVDFPDGVEEDYGDFRLFVRVRPLARLGMKNEMFTDATKGDILNPQLDDPSLNYCMELVEGYSPFEGGRPVPGSGWFEIADFDEAGVSEDVEVEVFLFWNSGRWCAEKRLAVRQCSHPARFLRRFPIVEAGGLIAIGELAMTGEPDFLVSVGARRQTAYRSDGEILWDHHDPDATGIASHNCLYPIYDIDGDGENEVIAVRRDESGYFLCILEGKTGATKRRALMPPAIKIVDDPPIINVQIANLRGLERPADIVFSHHYSDITAFDDQLNLLWRKDLWADEGRTVECPPPRAGAEARFSYGFGHTPAFADLDGDGHDEAVVGATLIDHDGRFLWNRKDLPRINADHNDSVAIADIDRDGNQSILLSSGLWCLDPDGNARWGFGYTVCHGQHVWACPVIPGSTRLQILLVDWRCYVGLEPPHAVYLLDGDGTVLWHRITGWAGPLYWRNGHHQDIWLKPEEMAGAGEIVDHQGTFLGYLPVGSMEAVRPFALPGSQTDTVVTKAVRNGTPCLEFYECARPSDEAVDGSRPDRYRHDDWQYSLY